MNRRERLMASLRGEPVDRPPVNFYEIDGAQDTDGADPFNIYAHASWKPLIELARARSDCIVRRGVRFKNAPPDPVAGLTRSETHTDAQGACLTTTTIQAGRRLLTTRCRRDPDVNTVWVLEHIAATGCTGLDPIEPPPQGDVELGYVRERYGRQMTLFGNLEASDIENLEPAEFEKKIRKAIRAGAAGKGRGFVLMPSACPYGRVLSARAGQLRKNDRMHRTIIVEND